MYLKQYLNSTLQCPGTQNCTSILPVVIRLITMAAASTVGIAYSLQYIRTCTVPYKYGKSTVVLVLYRYFYRYDTGTLVL